jgi:hypothetical protein
MTYKGGLNDFSGDFFWIYTFYNMALLDACLPHFWIF